jgi:hypothetical protein
MTRVLRVFWITLKLAAPKKGLKVGGEGLPKLVKIEAKNEN